VIDRRQKFQTSRSALVAMLAACVALAGCKEPEQHASAHPLPALGANIDETSV
jgi:hypothetical protein